MTEWRARILAARDRGRFTTDDLVDAGVNVAGQDCTGYSRCAVGEQADRYGAELFFSDPVWRQGVLDDSLAALGGRFAGAVSVGHFDDAEHLLTQIEDRALEIKRAAR